MTIATTSAKSRYAGDGSTISFPTGFKFIDNAHVRVVLLAANGSESLWTEGSEYSLNGAGAPGGGTVTVATSPTNYTPQTGETLVIKLAIPPNQQTSLPLGGAFPSTAVEGMADLAALRDQQLEEALSRALKFKETTALADVAMPEPAASKILAWNSGGTALENIDKPADGADGKSVLNGSGAPAGGTGAEGDFYIDTAADAIYGPKTGGAWGSATNLVGPAGATGPTGPAGADGADGVFSAIASQAEAEAGADNTKGMTPLRTAQAITAQSGIADNAVTNAKLADLAQNRIKGRVSSGSGDPEDLTAAQVRTMINVADGAEVNPALPSQANAEDGANTTEYSWTPQRVHQAAKDAVPVSLIVAVGDETTAITAGTGKVTFRLPHAMTLTAVRASLTTAGTTLTTVDINEGGTTILSTKLTIDANEKTSQSAAAAAVISDTALAADAEITIDIDGAGTSAAGLKVTLIGYKTTT